MCGIAGIVDFKYQRAAQHIGKMADTLSHRGPDDEGFSLFQISTGEFRAACGKDTPSELAYMPAISALKDYPCDAALAHRRLSILDLSPAGHGPLTTTDEQIWITYNGEVYNYIELRVELEKFGHTFQSGTDTEVIVAAYRQWGTDCIPRFNGMFSFGLWDRQQNRLFCVRDRFGIKPFYYFFRDGYFAFASEIKALVTNPEIPCCAKPEKIYNYLVNGAIVSDEDTFFEGIHQLPGSHALTLNAEGELTIWRYYDFEYQTHFTGNNYQEQVEAFRDLLTDSIRLRLRSDVAIGTSLSGGLDSSSVVMLANKLLQEEQGIRRDVIGDQQRVFCAVYAGEKFDEKQYMDTVIAQTGAQSNFTRPDAQKLWEHLERLIWHQDEPFSSTAIFAQYCVMELTRQNGVTVLLDGQGGDEVLGGYHFYYGYYLANALRAGRPDRFVKELRGARDVANAKWLPTLAITGYNLAPALLQNMGWKLAGAKMQSNKPISPEFIAPDFRYNGVSQIKHNAYPTLAQKLYDDVWSTNLPALLRYEDRNSMAFSIEARVPFLDYRLVEFAFSTSADAHIRNGWTKVLLRDAMKGILPEKIRLRRDKEGYTTPQSRWLQELTPQINTLFSQDVRSKNYLSAEAIRKLQSPDAYQISGLWRLVNLEVWLRAFH
ncbi:MAG: asparagine synthase (glutamine-hydrolyzing) [Anaerolineae bacterium]|nr:MAG: asparagine synthase (glutamine-hydrolyzing) [Anaerolineae bacterium]